MALSSWNRNSTYLEPPWDHIDRALIAVYSSLVRPLFPSILLHESFHRTKSFPIVWEVFKYVTSLQKWYHFVTQGKPIFYDVPMVSVKFTQLSPASLLCRNPHPFWPFDRALYLLQNYTASTHEICNVYSGILIVLSSGFCWPGWTKPFHDRSWRGFDVVGYNSALSLPLCDILLSVAAVLVCIH